MVRIFPVERADSVSIPTQPLGRSTQSRAANSLRSDRYSVLRLAAIAVNHNPILAIPDLSYFLGCGQYLIWRHFLWPRAAVGAALETARV